MFVEVISFCAINALGIQNPNMCVWYSDVNTYYDTQEECVNTANKTIENEILINEIILRMYISYQFYGQIDYTVYCINDTDVVEFFKDHNLYYEDVPETL